MKNTKQLAYSIIFHYAKYDSLSRQYDIDLNDIPEHDLCYLCATLMQEDDMIANEATGCDNENYNTIMLPSLIRLFKQPNDPERQYDFIENWKMGITKYLKNYLNTVLVDQLNEYNAVNQGVA